MTGHLAQNKERHADRFTRFKYRWERLTPLCFLRRDVRSLLFRFITLAVVRLGGRGRLREKLWDENLLCQTLSVHRETVKFRASFLFFLLSAWKRSFLEEKNLMYRKEIELINLFLCYDRNLKTWKF